MMAHDTLTIIFTALLGLSVLIYAVLDGYDLGVGILLPLGEENELRRDTYISSIGPFWDANETWLVLAVGILLIAFPSAHSLIMKELYLPVLAMLCGLILRGVAFDFRAKVGISHKYMWDKLFKAGSLAASLSQGFMLGQYVMGFRYGAGELFFSVLSALCVTSAYAYIGGAWLVMKTELELQKKAAYITRRAGWLAALGIFSVCVANPWVSEYVFDRWFSFPVIFLLLPIPLLCIGLFVVTDRYLSGVPHRGDFGCWIPFVLTLLIFLLCFQGLAYSFYPYIIPGEITIFEAVSARESLSFLLVGAIVVIPLILVYTLFSYRVFWGKTTQLRYY